MKCYNCGNEIPEQSVFCGMCGARLEPEPIPAEPIIKPTEPAEPEPETEPTEPTTESTEPEYNTAEAFADTDEYGQAEEFVINHCPYCGAVLMSGAKFCSNCGNSLVVYEQNMRNKSKISVKAVIAGVAAALVIIFCVGFLTNCRSIEGAWEVENSGGGFFNMFSESYLDFDDDGTAMYYNGLFTARKYNYTYNRFTKVLVLKSAGHGPDTEDSRLHVEWIDRYTIVIRELNMTLYRINDIPYAYDDDEYNDNDAVFY